MLQAVYSDLQVHAWVLFLKLLSDEVSSGETASGGGAMGSFLGLTVGVHAASSMLTANETNL